MSNESNNHEGHGHFIPVDFSEIQRARDGARMANQIAIHGVNTMLSELSEDQLTNMQVLVRSLADPEQGPALAAHLTGMVNAILHFKFAWCMCGDKHMEAEDMLLQDIADAPDLDAVDSNNADHWSDDPGETYSDPAPMVDMAAAAEVVVNRGRDALMDEYNLIMPLEGSTPVEVQCKLCGMRYLNLRDRMLMAPDECSGCRQKARHG